MFNQKRVIRKILRRQRHYNVANKQKLYQKHNVKYYQT